MIENFIIGHSWEDENGLAEIEKIFKRHTRNLFSNEINKCTCTLLSSLTGFFAMQCFFKDQQKTDGRDFKPDTVFSFQKTIQ